MNYPSVATWRCCHVPPLEAWMASARGAASRCLARLMLKQESAGHRMGTARQLHLEELQAPRQQSAWSHRCAACFWRSPCPAWSLVAGRRSSQGGVCERAQQLRWPGRARCQSAACSPWRHQNANDHLLVQNCLVGLTVQVVRTVKKATEPRRTAAATGASCCWRSACTAEKASAG